MRYDVQRHKKWQFSPNSRCRSNLIKILNQITVLLQTLSRSHSHESAPCTVDQFFFVSWCTLVAFLPPVAATASSSGPTCLGTFCKKFSILQNLKTASNFRHMQHWTVLTET